MNTNRIKTDGFSNPDSEQLMNQQWPDEPELAVQQNEGGQCGACSFFAPFNLDWGLCCHPNSRHHLETVFEHFTCASLAREGWGAHSWTEDEEDWCRCQDYLPVEGENELLILKIRVRQLEKEKWQAEYGYGVSIQVEGQSKWDTEENLREAIDQKLGLESD